jgi:hypothetical protein
MEQLKRSARFPGSGKNIVQECCCEYSINPQLPIHINPYQQGPGFLLEGSVHAFSYTILLWGVSCRQFGVDAMFTTNTMKRFVQELSTSVCTDTLQLLFSACLPPLNELNEFTRN